MTTSSSVEFTELSQIRAEQKQILRTLDMSRVQLEKLANSFCLNEKQRNLWTFTDDFSATWRKSTPIL